MNAPVESPWRKLVEMASMLDVEPKLLRKLASKKLVVHYRPTDRVFMFNVNDIPELKAQLQNAPRGRIRRPPEVREIQEHLQMHRYVYFIRPVAGGPIKIGNTDNLENRFKTIQASCPMRLALLAYAPGGQPLEKALHKKFRKSRLHGEWFRATPNLKKLVALLRERHFGERVS